MSKTFTQFRVDNVVTTLPTTLEYGKEVYYKDANGNLTLWVGHEDGTAWPAVGYKVIETNFLGSQTGIIKHDFQSATVSLAEEGQAILITVVGGLPTAPNLYKVVNSFTTGRVEGPGTICLIRSASTSTGATGILSYTVSDVSGNIITGASRSSVNINGQIRIYPNTN